VLLRSLGLAALAAVAGWVGWLRRRPPRVAHALIVSPPDHTGMDERTGAVRSAQSADLILPTEALDGIWTPRDLERLARTYWRFLSRVTLGTIQVDYTGDGRQVKALGLIPLLTFRAPEYWMSDERGIVRWRMEKGILVARRGHNDGYLEIDLRRRRSIDYPGSSIAHVEVEVANFYPAIAYALSRWLYDNTQSRIHVLVTHGFLRSLARLDLAESRVGRLSSIEDLPDPPPTGEPLSVPTADERDGAGPERGPRARVSPGPTPRS
jgi:hypothetical protein